MAASNLLQIIILKKRKSTKSLFSRWYVAASGYESLQTAAISCSHLQLLGQVAASVCFFENQNDARLLALCEIQGCRIPILQGSKVTGPQESTVAGFHGFKAPRFQSSGITVPGLSRVPRFPPPKDASFQGSKVNSRF